MTLPPITEDLIRQRATAQSFERGERYYRDGSVLSVVQRGQRLEARVAGSSYEPYQIEVAFDAGGIQSAFCSCPYDWGGWCKHIVAALLTALRDPGQIEERPPLAALLEGLEREALVSLLLELAEGRPELTNRIEGLVAREQARSDAASPADEKARPERPPVDPAPFRRQVQYALHSLDGMRPSEAYWHVSSVVDRVGEVLETAWEFIRAGDGENAMRVLEAITDVYVNEWYYLDDSDGYAGDFFITLGEAWTEAVLTAHVPESEREAWAEKMEGWEGQLDGYGIYSVFAPAQLALDLDPDLTQLRRALMIEDAETEPFLYYIHELVKAALNVLERQERYDVLLDLAQAAHKWSRYATILIQLDRVPEAVASALEHLRHPRQALTVAQALREHGDVEEAVRVAEHGLTLVGPKSQLAAWLRDVAASAGKTETALQAAVTAFRESPDLNGYRRVEELAGEAWPRLRSTLLDFLRGLEASGSSSVIEVFLHEDLVDDAIDALGREPYYYGTAATVANAAIERRPDWVIRVSKRQAEEIMDAGRSDIYHHAAEWLARAKGAYQAAGREDEWRSYLSQLLQKHHRKYKLVPMLKNLR